MNRAEMGTRVHELPWFGDLRPVQRLALEEARRAYPAFAAVKIQTAMALVGAFDLRYPHGWVACKVQP